MAELFLPQHPRTGRAVPHSMLDTFTLLLTIILQFEVIGFVLLLAWFFSRRARAMLGVSGAIMVFGAMLLLPVWYFWNRGEIHFAQINIALIALMLVVPGGLVIFLAYSLARSEKQLQASRLGIKVGTKGTTQDLADAEELEDDLRAAMRDTGQLYLVYQPIYSAAKQAVIGFEALARWRHPRRGDISPASFIPLAEQSRLIIPLGAWILETACAVAATWPEPLYLSVNLSPVQLERRNLVRDVRASLARSGLAPERLELEVTESVMVTARSDELARLAELRRDGLRVAIDDFGTGYSSLSFLRQMRFDTIKIDRSFVQNLEDDGSARAIVATIIELSRQLDCQIVAEGVETEAQLTILSGLHCQRIQGWVIGKPMAPATILKTYFPTISPPLGWT